MSHISRIRTHITDLSLLLQALTDLGYQPETGEDLEIKGMAAASIKVEVKIPLRMSSDIGFRKVGDFYEIVADWWSVRVVKQKEVTDKVSQLYAYCAAVQKLKEHGFNLVSQETGEKGQIRLVLRRMA